MIKLKTLEEIEKTVILDRLKFFKWHRRKTAESLRMGIRTLTNKCKLWGVPPKRTNIRRKIEAKSGEDHQLVR